MQRGYAETYRRSLERPEEFWAEAAEAIDWDRRWDRVLDRSRSPFCRWFLGARLNTCWNALDRHVASGRGERGALVWDSPVTAQIKELTYGGLRDCRPARRWPRGARRREGRSRSDLYADGNARLRPPRRRPFGRLRRLCRARVGDPHRRRQAARHPVGLMRPRGRGDHSLEATARGRDRRGGGEAGALHHSTAADVPSRPRAGARP